MNNPLTLLKNLINLATKYTELIYRLEKLELHQKELYNLHDCIDEDISEIEKQLLKNNEEFNKFKDKVKNNVRIKSGGNL